MAVRRRRVPLSGGARRPGDGPQDHRPGHSPRRKDEEWLRQSMASQVRNAGEGGHGDTWRQGRLEHAEKSRDETLQSRRSSSGGDAEHDEGYGGEGGTGWSEPGHSGGGSGHRHAKEGEDARRGQVVAGQRACQPISGGGRDSTGEEREARQCSDLAEKPARPGNERGKDAGQQAREQDTEDEEKHRKAITVSGGQGREVDYGHGGML